MTAIIKINETHKLAALITNGLVTCQYFFTSFKIVENSTWFKRVEFYNKKVNIGFVLADELEMSD